MRFCAISLLLIPLFLFAQEPRPAPSTPAAAPAATPPAAVDQALRERATAFLQYQVEGNFRKAYDLVAEDSKDYYLGSSKEKAASSVIEEIQYADDFSKAVVKVAATRRLVVAARVIDIPSVVLDRWKFEDGKWMWYHDTQDDRILSIFGPVAAGPVAAGPVAAGPVAAGPGKPGTAAGSSALPKDTSPEAVAAAASQALAHATSIDKAALTFTRGKEETQQVIFHNGYLGVVRVNGWAQGPAPGITVEPSSSLVNAQSDLNLRITYRPVDKGPAFVTVRLEVEPFGSVFLVQATIAPEDGDSKQ